MVDALAAADARENARLLVCAVRRDQDRDRLADDLLGGVAEQPLGARIPGLDDPVEILADDGIVRGFHDRDELLRRSSAARRASSALSLAMPKPSCRASVSATSISDVGEAMRLIVIGHEFPGEPAADPDRDESNRGDAFARNRFLQGIGKIRLPNVLETDRPRISFVPVPWRMAFDGLPVPVRQTPPSDETHHVAVVKQAEWRRARRRAPRGWRPGRRRKRLEVTWRIAAFRRTGTAPPALRCGAPAPVRPACGR